MFREAFAAKAELKFVGDPEAGQVGGYGSVYGVLDSHGDLIKPGAFDNTLAEQKASGRIIPMFVEHSFAMFGGDPLPIGKWTNVKSDERGLRVEGQLIGLDHPDVGRVRELVKSQLIEGLSIAYRVRENGSIKGKKPGEPARTLTDIDLFSIDLVGDPSNPLAKIDQMKAMLTMPNHQQAADAIQQAHQMCMDCMGGGDAPTTDERNQIVGKMREAYTSLTGNDMPMKMQFDQLRELKRWLHLPVEQGGRGFSAKQADEIAELVFKSMPRDESGDAAAATAARQQAVTEIRSMLSGFSLKFGD